MHRAWLVVLGALVSTTTFAGIGVAEDEVLVTVGDRGITAVQLEEELRRRQAGSDFDFDEEDPEVRRSALDALVNRSLLAQGGLESRPDGQAVYDSMATYARLAEIWAAVQAELQPPAAALTDSAIAEFRKVRARRWYGRHIVVTNEEEVTEVFRRLETGERFADLAKELSHDSGTSAAGGRLFPARYGDWYLQLTDLFFSLTPGTYGGPVESRFGLHIAYCERIQDEPEPVLQISDERLRNSRRDFEVMSRIDSWMDAFLDETPIRIHEDALPLVLENLTQMTSGSDPPSTHTTWIAPEIPFAEWDADGGGSMTVREYIANQGALGPLEWPRPKNWPSIRTSAERLAAAFVLLGRNQRGEFPLEPRAEARILGDAQRAVGNLVIHEEFDPGEIDSLRAEEIFVSHASAFRVAETVSVASLALADRELAENVVDWVREGTPFEDAVDRLGAETTKYVYTPYLPFFPKGAFPDTDKQIFALEVGEITDPIPLSGDYYLFLVLDKRPPRQRRRIEMTIGELQRDARRALADEAMANSLDDLRGRHPVRYDDKALDRWVDLSSR